MKIIFRVVLGFILVVAGAPSRLPAAEVAPIVDQGWLLGGFSQGKWLSAKDTAKALLGRETYQLCTLTRFLGRALGSKPKSNPAIEVGPEFGITFNPAFKSREPVVAVGGTWKAMPRQPRLLTDNLQPYVEAAQAVLKSKGITDPQVNLIQVIEIDLDDDGVKEVLVGARRFTMPHRSDVLNNGDYSMVFVHKKATGAANNILVEGQFQTASRPETGLALSYQVTGLVDADGDGIMEIMVNYTYYEGGDARLFQLKGDQAELVLGEDWGA